MQTTIMRKRINKRLCERRFTENFAEPEGIISNRNKLIDTQDDECQHHGEGVVPHDPRVVVQQLRVEDVDEESDEKAYAR